MSRKKGRLVVDPVNPPLVDIFSLADLQTVLNSNTSVTPAANKIPKADGSGKINTGYLNASATPAANTIPIADSNNKLNVNWLDFVQNFGTNGYCKLPNGLILQWGRTDIAMVIGTGSFGYWTLILPITFPTSILSANISWGEVNAQDATEAVVCLTGLNTSNIGIVAERWAGSNAGPEITRVYFWAIGY